jgi:ribosomal protein L28
MNKVQELYGEKVLREARIYLAREALRQIKEGKLDAYLNSKKLKDKEKFKRYV